MTRASKLHVVLVAVAAVVILTTWGIGLMSGDLASIPDSVGAVLFLIELPLVTLWLLPGGLAVRLGVLLTVLTAVDGVRVYVLESTEMMYLAEAWPWIVVMVGVWLLYRARRKTNRPAAQDRSAGYGTSRVVSVPWTS